MAVASEIQSLEEIRYQSPSKWKSLAVMTAAGFLMLVGFLNYYPIGDALKKVIRAQTAGTNCTPDFAQVSVQPFLAKLIITDLELPASCFNRQGDSLKFSHLTLNYHLISFFPFGLPFRIDTELAAQPISMHYVLGLGEHVVRIKDQKFRLDKVIPLLAPSMKLAGSLTVDLNMRTNMQGNMKSMLFKAASRDLELPSQNVMDFNLPNLKINDLYVEAHSDAPPRITVDRLTAGNPNSPIRANFRGKIDLQPGGAAFSPMDLVGEVALSKPLIETLPLLELLMQSFPQKDGFYQVRLGGTLGAPRGTAP